MPLPCRLDLRQWTFTRGAADTNLDIRELCATGGYCLFKIGGTLEDVARDVVLEQRQ